MPKSARLEIHQINVGQGDSILIINRDLDKVEKAIEDKGETPPANMIDYVPFALSKKVPLLGTVAKALLIDGGDDCYAGNVGAYLVQQGIAERPSHRDGVFCENLSVLVSHWHDDHMQGVKGVYGQRDVEPIQTKKPKRKRGKSAAYKKPPVNIRPATMYVPKPSGRAGRNRKVYRDAMARIATIGAGTDEQSKRVNIGPAGLDDGPKGPPFTIDLGTGINDIPITAHVLAAAQSVYFKAGAKPIKSKAANVDQNDTSIVLVIEYGSFRYFCGGDIAGNGMKAGGNEDRNTMDPDEMNNFSLSHADVESTLGPALEAYFPRTGDDDYEAGKPKVLSPGSCTVAKLSHHGSMSSNDVYMLATLRPQVIVCSSGLRARFHWHPTDQVINRITVAATPEWNVRQAKPGPKPDPVPNTVGAVYLTEVAEKFVHGKKKQVFEVDLQGAKIMGSIVVRPIDETVLDVQEATAPKASTLSFQVYGNGQRTDLGKAGAGYKVRDAVPLATSGYYPIEPVQHDLQH